ncbi:bifunctional transcriptional activator/DNA repair enzyme protein Ada, partial [Mesorhizobium sp. M7A.F.Ca.CA.004.02.1.1]
MARPAFGGFNAAMFITLAKNLKSTPLQAADDPRWARIVARDKSADGAFWY